MVQPPLTPGHPKTSQCCILPCTARIASCHTVNRDNFAPFLFLYESSKLGRSGIPWLHLNLLMPGVASAWETSDCTFWVVLKLYSCCLHHVDCDRHGKLLLPKVNYLETLQTGVPRKALWAVLVCSRLHPVTPSERDTPQSNSRTTWADLLEIQPSTFEKSFELKQVFHWTPGEFLWLHECVNRFKTQYSISLIVIANSS